MYRKTAIPPNRPHQPFPLLFDKLTFEHWRKCGHVPSQIALHNWYNQLIVNVTAFFFWNWYELFPSPTWKVILIRQRQINKRIVQTVTGSGRAVAPFLFCILLIDLNRTNWCNLNWIINPVTVVAIVRSVGAGVREQNSCNLCENSVPSANAKSLSSAERISFPI